MSRAALLRLARKIFRKHGGTLEFRPSIALACRCLVHYCPLCYRLHMHGQVDGEPLGRRHDEKEALMPQPAVKRPPDPPQRDPLGRFLNGNSEGKGNPFARHSAALRKAFYDAVSPEDLHELATMMMTAAKGGDWMAAQILLRWLLGRPPEAVDPYQVMVHQAAIEVMEMARKFEKGEPITDPQVPQPKSVSPVW